MNKEEQTSTPEEAPQKVPTQHQSGLPGPIWTPLIPASFDK